MFGLHAVGQAALKDQDPGPMSIVDSIRWEQGIWFILIGLALLAVGAILVAVAVWRSGLGLEVGRGSPGRRARHCSSRSSRRPSLSGSAYGVLLFVGCAAFAVWLARLDRPGTGDVR